MKTTRRLAFVVLMLLAVPALAETVASMPAPTGYIDDYAHVLSSPAISGMEAAARELHDKTRAQVFLVTINTLEGEPVEQFANELFAKWKIGEKKTDRGVLMLFAIKDRKRWIEIGYGLEGILNDAKVGDIGRDMVPALRAQNYDEATKLGLGKICSIIAVDSGVTLSGTSDTTGPGQQEASTSPVESPQQHKRANISLLILILSTIIGLGALPIILILALRRNLRRRGVVIGGWDGGRSLSDSDSGFSSSDSVFGSDDSFGGGDGGSSGGGGAGGDW